jgi:hypothetical protein
MRLNVDGNETYGACEDATSFPLMRPNVALSGARERACIQKPLIAYRPG